MPQVYVTVPNKNKCVELIKDVFPSAHLTPPGTWLPDSITATFDANSTVQMKPVDAWILQGIAHDLHSRPPESINFGWRTAVRFTIDGELCQYRLKPATSNPPIDELIRILDAPDRIAVKLATLDKFIRDHKRTHIPPSWKNQVDYGKRYMTRQLLKGGAAWK